jgi:NADH-quinone oxidoreductase subunit H
LPECEAEIVAGYHTEYSSMKYAMFPMGEYVAMCAMAGIAVHFFLGGYHMPGGLTNWWGLIIGNPEAVAYPPAFLGLPDDFSRALSVSAIGFSSVLTFAVKTLLVVFVFMWIRATVPRFRYDQLMKFGWKVLVPVGLILVLLTAILHVFTPVAVDNQVITEVAVNAGH